MHSSILLFLNIGGQETMLIVFVALLLFGGKKLPELARGLGKGIREFKDASESVKTEIHRNINAVNDDLSIDMEAAKRRDEPAITEHKAPKDYAATESDMEAIKRGDDQNPTEKKLI